MADYDFDQTLAANEQVMVHCPEAAHIQVIAGSARFWVQPDGRGTIPLELGLGQRIKRGFKTLRVVNGDTEQRIALKISDGDVTDNRLVGQVDISGGLRQAANRTTSYGNAVVGLAASNVVAANTSRANVLIQNLGPGIVYHGTDSAVTTANGIQIPVGGAIPITHDDDVYLISDTANTDVRYLEETL